MRPYPILILCVALLLGACAADETPKDPFLFRLEFVATSETEGTTPIGDRTVIASGTSLRVVLERLGTGRVYLIHRDPDDAITVLYPHKGQLAQQERQVTILDSRLDDKTGLETFHLIASEKPLEQLERAISDVHDGKEGVASALKAEVLALRKRHESMTAKAWRPAPIGGQMRSGGDPDAVEYTVRGALCRTYTIDHR